MATKIWVSHSSQCRGTFLGKTTQQSSPTAFPGPLFNYSAIKSPVSFSLTFLCDWKYFTPIHPSNLSSGCLYTTHCTASESEKPKTAELHVVKGDLLSSVSAHQAALCRDFLGITSDGDSKPHCLFFPRWMTQAKANRKNRPTEQRGYSAPGPGPQVHDVHDDTKNSLHWVFSASVTGFQAKSRNLVCPGRKEPHLSQQSALWEHPTAVKLHTQVNPAQVCVGDPSCLACLALVDHKPCS